MQAAEVTIYVTEYCGYCAMAKRLLTQKQVRFTEINVEGRDDLRAWMVKASGQRTVPQIFINGDSVGGFSELSALDKKGQLDARLNEPPRADAPTLPR
ncbi:glutaredoxin [Sorangium cellulosum]|uniref:Glutaredoxin n=1 Tax=Sorangium cellulosum TaxID=56 RepID=A0A2L0F8E7_SORCE|nr:glutaredoxin 3 [Sorangium cellulosum]AUX47855.1 glutaredoxin [Sorangium cellulosum]